MFILNRNVGSFICRNCSKRAFHTSPILTTFWERDDKGGYRDESKLPQLKDRLREGLKELKHEVGLWSEELKERFENDPILTYRPGEVDVQWQFGTEDSLKKWLVTSDSDNNEGFSKSSLTLTKEGKGLFSGNLDMRIPKDGRVKRAGYCNMKTLRVRVYLAKHFHYTLLICSFQKSFKREAHIDWTAYNMLVMRVRGDGRSYLLNIHAKGYYDLTWNDMYHYVLFTRGGPYWQVARVSVLKLTSFFVLDTIKRIVNCQVCS